MSHAIVRTVRTVCTASSARTLHCITIVHYDIDGALLLTSRVVKLSLRGSLVQLDITPRGR